MTSVRRRLPNRRRAETFSLEVGGLRYTCTVGRFADGSIGELFITNHRAGSAAGILASDAAIGASLALQFGCPVEMLRRALSRDGRGNATSPLGVALDQISKGDR
jgi:ribonucleoside-diphosphate reductase alpha chain